MTLVGRPFKPSVDVIVIESCYSLSCRSRVTWEEDRDSDAAMVYHCKDSVVAITFGQLRDKVHGYHLEWECVCRHWDFEQGWSRRVRSRFVLLAHCTTFHVLCNPRLQRWPPE